MNGPEPTRPTDERAPGWTARGIDVPLQRDGIARVVRHFLYYLPTRGLPAVAGLVVLPFLTRSLSTSEFGILALAQTLISLGWTVTGGWLGAAVVREFSGHAARGELGVFSRTLARGMRWSFLMLLVFSGGVVLFGALNNGMRPVAPFVVIACVGQILQNISVSLLVAKLRPLIYATLETSCRVGGIALGLVLLKQGHGVPGYIAGLGIVSTIVGAIALLVAWPRAHGAPATTSADVRRWLIYGFTLSAAGIALWALSFIDRYLLSAMTSTSDVGVYAVGNLIGDKFISLPLLSFLAAANPLIINHFERHGPEHVEQQLFRYCRVLFIIGAPMLGFVFAFSGRIIPVATGSSSYGAALHVAWLISIGSFLFVLGSLAEVGIILSRRLNPILWASLIGLASNVIANVVLIPRLGILGAAIATPVGTGTFLAAIVWWARLTMPLRWPVTTILQSAAAATVGYAVARALLAGVPGELAAPLTAGAVGLVAYGGVLTGLHRLLPQRPLSPRRGPSSAP